MNKFTAHNLDFNDGLLGAYTEIANQGEMLNIFAFRANYEIDIFNLNSHQEAIQFLVDKLEADLVVLHKRLPDKTPKSTTRIDDLIAQLQALKKVGHTEVYAYKPYPAVGYELINVKLMEIQVDELHREDNPDKSLPDKLVIWDNTPSSRKIA